MGGAPEPAVFEAEGLYVVLRPRNFRKGWVPAPAGPLAAHPPPILRLRHTSWWGEVLYKLCYYNERVGKEGGYENISRLSPSVAALIRILFYEFNCRRGTKGGAGGSPISPMHSIRISLHAIR